MLITHARRLGMFGLILGWLLLVTFWVSAQGTNYTPYTWVEGELALVYPAEWEDPVPSTADGTQILNMAQAFAADPIATRPPGIPFLVLSLHETGDGSQLIASDFQQMGMPPMDTVTTTWLGTAAVMTTGTSDDGTLFGIGQAVTLPDGRVLVVSGRVLVEQRDSFRQTFDAVANSVVLGADAVPELPQYGVLWHTERTAADGVTAFINLRGLTAASDGTLYAVDSDFSIGVIQLDAATGDVLRTVAFDALWQPVDIAVDGAGTVYVADVACGCVQVLDIGGDWRSMGQFSVEAPAHLLVTTEGVLYATDSVDDEPVVRVFDSAAEQTVSFDAAPSAQPALTVDQTGVIWAVDSTGGAFRLQGDTFVYVYAVAEPNIEINAVTFDASNNLVVATATQGVLIVDASGVVIDRVGRVVPGFPLAGELVSPTGVVVDAAGTVYWADSDGTFGAITAMSTRVETGRVGATQLVPGVPVQGVLDDFTAQQSWTFDGVGGQRVSLTAVGTDVAGQLDVALRLLAPDGTEIAFNDDHEGDRLFGFFDAEIPDLTLPMDGTYVILVEQVAGTGTYMLGISLTRTFELVDGAGQHTGEISDVIPAQRWAFEGRAGQVITITMTAESGTLDPIIRLYDARGTLIDENDDSADISMGRDSQLAQVQLPANGFYTIEATRFDGEGRYQLILVTTSP